MAGKAGREEILTFHDLTGRKEDKFSKIVFTWILEKTEHCKAPLSSTEYGQLLPGSLWATNML